MYVQTNALLSGYICEKFRIMCLKIYKLDPAKFLSGLGLAWQKRTKVKLDLLTDIDINWYCY